MWHDTAFTRRFDLRYPIVQGPFGGGFSSARLAATVSDAGGLGSFGAQGMTPDQARSVIRVSIGIDTTEAEVDGFAAAVGECVERLRAGALL